MLEFMTILPSLQYKIDSFLQNITGLSIYNILINGPTQTAIDQKVVQIISLPIHREETFYKKIWTFMVICDNWLLCYFILVLESKKKPSP